MGRPKKKTDKTAVIIAWRKGEDDLQATIESVGKSIPGALVIAVEDKEGQGPARTRDRGIMEASDCQNIILIDAHMRFKGKVLADMAAHLSKKGGLIVPKCYDIDGETIRMDREYAGARIVYRAQDGQERTSLCAKWAKDHALGDRGAVMGACYGFRRDWYLSVGRPLAALPGWGGDEEILSIAAWISGEKVELVDGVVGHRFRTSVPWKRDARQIAADSQAKLSSRMTVIHCVADEVSRGELFDWQGNGRNNHNLKAYATPEAERCRKALLGFARNFADWRKDICEPDEIDGAQGGKPSEQPKPRKQYQQNIVVTVSGVTCPICKTVKDSFLVTNTTTYQNGNISRRHQCDSCGGAFRTMFYSK